MITSLRRAEIVRAAHDVLADDGLTSLPINPKTVADNRGITVRSWQPSELGISGFLMKAGDDFGIGYSSAISNEGFENFTIAHELGHYFLDGHVDALFAGGDTCHYSKSGYISNDLHEKEADLFASELLMPEPLFKASIQRGGLGFGLIKRLAAEAKTSLVSTAIRCCKLGEDPLAVILSQGDEVQWCFMTDSFKECQGVYLLPKKSLVPRMTATYAFNASQTNVAKALQREDHASLRRWFERARDIEIQEDVVGLGHYGKTLTVLFSDELLDEDDVEDDNFDDDDHSGRDERGRGTWKGSWWRGD